MRDGHWVPAARDQYLVVHKWDKSLTLHGIFSARIHLT